MKVILLLAGLLALALAAEDVRKPIPKKYKIGDKAVLEKQLTVLRFFKYVQQRSEYKEILELGKGFYPESHLDLYKEPHYVEELMQLQKHDFLPKDAIFSVFYQEHLEQAIALFKVFYYAKDWDTFVKTAAWASEWANEGMFIYSFSVALVHRHDAHGLIIPPIHEVNPYYFFNSEIIAQAQHYKQTFHGDYPTDAAGYKGFTIAANYSGWYLNLEPEQYLSYFTEDIGLNSLYYMYHLYYPFWMSSDEFQLKKDRRGEIFYALHQTLWAKYYSERLSHNYEELHHLTAGSDLPSYYSSLEYPSGADFPSRPPWSKLNWYHGHGKTYYNFTGSYYRAVDYSRRMRDSIGLGFVYTHSGQKVSLYTDNGIEIFASMLEGTADSPNMDYYGMVQMYVRHILGHAPTPLNKDHVLPAAVEHYETCLRDPAYWKFVKSIVYYFQEYKQHQPHKYYTKQDMYYPEFEVENIQVDRLITFFEWYYSDMSFGVYYNLKHETEPFHVRVRQQRLNHKPFTYTVNVQSKKAAPVVVRVYMGPKYDLYGREMDITENRLNFYLIDKFPYSMKMGKNAIVRNSEQTITVSDRTSYWQLYKRVMGAIKASEEFAIDGSETYWGLPNRLLLPTGKPGGMPYQFYVIVTPLDVPEDAPKSVAEGYYPPVGSGLKMWYDHFAFGYPFDKPIDKSVFFVPNSHFQDVVIYHKKFEDLNVSSHHE